MIGLKPGLCALISLFCSQISVAAPPPTRPAPAPTQALFNRDIRPILSDNCFACHGPDKNKRQADLRLDQPNRTVVPGKVSASELARRINLPEGADGHMPPATFHKTLTAAQKQLLMRWIRAGGVYQKHWAYEPPMKAAIPAGQNAIDFLVRKRLAERALKPSPEADRRTLIRRLSFDLLGLPSAPAEVAAFVRDTSPQAYSKLVERLLANPHYGERMAQGWLDVVRFADTIGYHSDNPRNIWPYRDWVIEAFNRNKRFDRFTREQLAGDLLPDANQETRVGSAFNRLLLTTEEGGAQAKDYEARYLTDRVRAVGTVWLGQTTGCAQCHDHKFDPITTRDFYSLGAFFADVDEAIIGSREPGMLVLDADQTRELAKRSARLADLQQSYDGAHPELAQVRRDWEQSARETLKQRALWKSLKPVSASALAGTQLTVDSTDAILAKGPNPEKNTYTLQTEASGAILGLRIEVLPDASLPANGPGRAPNGNFVLTEAEARVVAPNASSRALKFASAQASFEQTLYAEANPYKIWNAASVIDADVKGDSWGWAVLPESGKAHSLVLTLAEPLTLNAGEKLEITLKQNHGSSHTLGKFRLYSTNNAESLGAFTAFPTEVEEALQVPAEKRTPAQTATLDAHFKSIVPELAELRTQLAEARKAKGDFEASLPRCLVTVRNAKPRTVRVLPRGNFLDETGAVVQPATPAFLPGQTGGTRLNLANWIVSRQNPLTARAVMNRLWKQFFGGGLCKVLEDLGAQGEPPTNPALLDWLACEFMDSGWDLKHMVRLLVGSATYRQVSTADPILMTRDPYNREFARQGRFRLEAEEIRDNALAISGLLSSKIGGPSVKPYQPERYWDNLNFPVRDYVADKGENQYRRGLYTWWQRSFLHPSLLAFDAPSREECTADRTRSNIPQQALVLLNDPTYVEAARAFGLHILTGTSGTPQQRLVWAWQQALQRTPTARELSVLQKLYAQQKETYRADPASANALLKVGDAPVPEKLDPVELAAWTHVARVLLNLHETITRP